MHEFRPQEGQMLNSKLHSLLTQFVEVSIRIIHVLSIRFLSTDLQRGSKGVQPQLQKTNEMSHTVVGFPKDGRTS